MKVSIFGSGSIGLRHLVNLVKLRNELKISSIYAYDSINKRNFLGKEKNFKLAILSNGTPTLLKELVKSNNLDNVFDDLFSIEEVGIYKPDSKVYDLPVNKYKIQKNEINYRTSARDQRSTRSAKSDEKGYSSSA